MHRFSKGMPAAWRRPPGTPHHRFLVILWLLLLLEIRALQAFVIHSNAPSHWPRPRQNPLGATPQETPSAPDGQDPNTDADDGATMLPAMERQLGPRLAAVLRLVPRTSRVVADVGCDHFQLGMALALSNGARATSSPLVRVIGVDKAAAPLEMARQNLGRLPRARTLDEEGAVAEVWGRVLELRLGDGLRALTAGDKVDCVAIAGMGTRSIVGEVLAGPAAKGVLGGVRHLVLQAYDPRPLFMRDLRAHLTTTLRDNRLGPDGAGYAIVDESIVLADNRIFITLLAEAAAAHGGGEKIKEEENDDMAFRRLLLGRHLSRRARDEPETRALYGEYLRHHRQWFFKLMAARGGSGGGSGDNNAEQDPTVRALTAIERELAELNLN